MKVPKARKLESGSWFIQLRLGGESISITKPTGKECVREAQRVKADYLAGLKIPATGQNVPLYDAMEIYISSRTNVLSPSTIRGYKTIQTHRFKAYQQKAIGSVDWQSAVNFEAKLCSPKTLKNAWGLVNSVLCTNGIDVEVRLPTVALKEHSWLTPEQIPVFMGAVKGQACEIPALLALSSLRRSEIYGLSWDDIDLDKQIVHIRGAMLQDMDGKLIHRDQNKTTKSTRDVPIMVPQLQVALETVENKSGAVVCTNISTAYKQVRRVCERAGLPNVGLHGLRHSFASLCYSLKISEKVCMRLGGWSDYQTMRKIYTHLFEMDSKRGTELIAQFFNNANENANEFNKTQYFQ